MINRRTLLAAAVLPMAACARGPERTELSIAVGGQSLLVYLPLTLARQLGYFDEAGVRVRIDDFQGGSKALQALQGGSADMVCGYYDHTIQMQAKGRDITSFVTMLRYPSLVLAVSPATNRTVRSLHDLAGANIGVTAPGSSSDFFLRYLLTANGIATTAVSIQGVGGGAGAIAAMSTGRVDAAVLVEPAISVLRKRSGATGVEILADTRTSAGVERFLGVPNYPAAVLYSNLSWIDGNHDAVRRVAKAITLALQWISSHTAAEIAERMPPEYAGGDREAYIEAIAAMIDSFSPDGVMPENGAAAVRAVLAASDPQIAQAAIDLGRTYTNRYL
ncbi:ABC transporter substrate-binding protein [Nocardia inohanensis]|uniref:ABC transporter substrate-binding protein n=1 Tax=Nocardia inohanensis TaxID=209246 RepID=UPI000A010952|nr:ABC transporter substrate-binding protein [Nocardia inohanensis]